MQADPELARKRDEGPFRSSSRWRCRPRPPSEGPWSEVPPARSRDAVAARRAGRRHASWLCCPRGPGRSANGLERPSPASMHLKSSCPVRDTIGSGSVRFGGLARDMAGPDRHPRRRAARPESPDSRERSGPTRITQTARTPLMSRSPIEFHILIRHANLYISCLVILSATVAGCVQHGPTGDASVVGTASASAPSSATSAAKDPAECCSGKDSEGRARRPAAGRPGRRDVAGPGGPRRPAG